MNMIWNCKGIICMMVLFTIHRKKKILNIVTVPKKILIFMEKDVIMKIKKEEEFMMSRLPGDFVKNRKYDERIVRTLYMIVDEIDGELVPALIEDMKEGKLPPVKDWYWNTYYDTPCYIKDNQVYALSWETVGVMECLGTLDEYREEYDGRIRLREYGEARKKYLIEEKRWSYGEELLEHCKEVEDRADEMEEQMMLARMREYESLKDTDPIRYGKIWNNERASVQEVIYREVIYN